MQVLRNVESGKRSLELQLDDGKSGFCRTVNLIDVTKTSEIKVLEIYEAYFEAAEFEMEEWPEGDFIIRRPDFEVVRVYLGAADGDAVANLETALADYGELDVVYHLQHTVFYAGLRKRCIDNERKEYVNVASSRRGDAALERLVAWLKLCGFTAISTPGPFVRATFGYTLSLMPLCTASTYTGMIDQLPEAEKLARPDSDFDLEGRSEASYGNHSLRQLADRSARDNRHKSGATEVEIDRMFGWNEAAYRKVMQLHYAGRHERVAHAHHGVHVSRASRGARGAAA